MSNENEAPALAGEVVWSAEDRSCAVTVAPEHPEVPVPWAQIDGEWVRCSTVLGRAVLGAAFMAERAAREKAEALTRTPRFVTEEDERRRGESTIRCTTCQRFFVYIREKDRQTEGDTAFVVCPCGARRTLRIGSAP